jgi:hypothetical protein
LSFPKRRPLECAAISLSTATQTAPTDIVRFHDTRTEHIIAAQMPPRPVNVYSSSGAMCTRARFAESDVDARLDGGK